MFKRHAVDIGIYWGPKRNTVLIEATVELESGVLYVNHYRYRFAVISSELQSYPTIELRSFDGNELYRSWDCYEYPQSDMLNRILIRHVLVQTRKNVTKFLFVHNGRKINVRDFVIRFQTRVLMDEYGRIQLSGGW